TDLRFRQQRIANLQGGRTLRKGVDEPVVNAAFHDEAGRSRTALAGRIKRSVDGAFDGGIEVGIVEHDERVLAAHFKLDLAGALGAGDRDPVAGRNGTGEGDGVDIAVVDDFGAD